MKLSHKVILVSVLILLTYLVVEFIILQYEEYNERRGYCTAEGKFLSDKEKLKNIRVNLIVHHLQSRSKHYDDYNFSIVGISKYDLSNEEKVIDLMTQADFNKSWKENLGIIAIGSIPEYIGRRECLRDRQRCYINQSNKGFVTLWSDDNSINIEYLRSLPENYSIITREGSGVNLDIYPLSTLQQIDAKHYKISRYSINQRCCDQQEIKRWTPFVGNNLTNISRHPEKYAAYRRGEIGITPEPELRLDQIDGVIIDDFYVSDLYADSLLNQPQQVQKYGLLWSAGGLRKPVYKKNMKQEISITACGTIVEKK
ncbi:MULTISPECIES: hypothetical protein [unclassified Acinetobacter]|uniref:hypothetical protein n=1 Tax=unclassified Acinetobacter TaxID=196816 RepID=UPI00190CA290|nr:MULTISPECIES: hypothetical protein [unclassified Acinetobacter]MBK0064661.1 hypothetical protein [Acinetobacter sp. S55]MBK0067950.1 hypothetical protein [Acinetobacter sp. S54]